MFKLLLLVAVLACAAAYFLEGPDGAPLIDVERALSGDVLDELARDWLPASAQQESSTPHPGRIYKWQDSNGVWQFSNDPADADGAVMLDIDGAVNVLPTLTGTGAPPTFIDDLPADTFALSDDSRSVTREQLQEMTETVQGYQDTINARKAATDEVIRDN